MNCFDDIYVTNNNYLFSENIDYLLNEIAILDAELIKCYKQLKFDISIIIPSTMTIRLKNIVWRRLNKNLDSLAEIDPQTINWHKDQDINWCFGPKFDSSDLIPPKDAGIEQPYEIEEPVPLQYTVSNSSTESVSSTDSLLSSASYSTDESNQMNPGFYKKHKKVKFNYIVNSREIINGISIDYDFLDNSMINDL